MPQAAQQQARAHQQHNCESDLLRQPECYVSLVAASGAPGALLHPDVQLTARSLQRRNQPHRDADKRRDTEPKCEDRAIEVNGVQTRQSGRAESHQCMNTELRHDHPDSAAESRKQQAFREQLPDEAFPWGAKRSTHRKLTARWAPRASRRFVTLTHAISRTRVTAPRTARSAGLTPSVMSLCSEFTRVPFGAPPELSYPLAYICARGRRITSRSLRACSLLTPGRSRPTMRGQPLTTGFSLIVCNGEFFLALMLFFAVVSPSCYCRRVIGLLTG